MGNPLQLDGAVIDRAHFLFDDLEQMQNVYKLSVCMIHDLVGLMLEHPRRDPDGAGHRA
jgi:hypothetical protein